MAPVGHDGRVLHGLCLHQAEHLGAEVLGAIRPAQTASGDGPAAQVDALHGVGIHVDLAVRDHRADAGQLGRVDLERQVVLRLPVRPELEPVGTQGRSHEAVQCAPNALVVERRGGIHQGGHVTIGLFGVRMVRAVGVETGIEERQQRVDEIRCGEQRIDDVVG